MPLRSFLAFAGFVMLIASTYCPLFRAFGLASFTLFDVNKPYGLVIILVCVVGILGVVLRQLSILRTCAWLALGLVILLLLAATLKVNSTFSFIPFKGLARAATRAIKYKWGWYMMFGGAFLALIGALTTKRSVVASNGNKL